MKTLNIDQEFKDLIPPISYEEEELLVESIKKEGCHTPLVVWGDILVDGHNRYEICTENDIEFETRSVDFADRDDAKIWIIKNQFGRRNLSTPNRCDLALQMKALVEAKAKEAQAKAGGDKKSEEVKSLCMKKDKAVVTPSLPTPTIRPSGYTYTGNVEYKLEQYNPPEPQIVITDQPVNTLKVLGEMADVSRDTMYKYSKILENGTPQQIKAVREEEETINKVFNKIKEAGMTDEKRAAMKERSDKLELEKAKKKNKEAQDSQARYEHSNYARTVVNGAISDLNRIPLNDPSRTKELNRLMSWIKAAMEATDEIDTRTDKENQR